MSRIRVHRPGLLTTVQDLGRFGWAHFGVSASGAADPLALRAGNLLVGNAENAAALEMTLVGGAFEFEARRGDRAHRFGFRRGPAAVEPGGSEGRRQTVRLGPFAIGSALLPVRARRPRGAQGDGQRFRPRDRRASAAARCAPATCFPSATTPMRRPRPAGQGRPPRLGDGALRVTARSASRMVRATTSTAAPTPCQRGIQSHGAPSARTGDAQPGRPHAHRRRAPLGAVQVPPDGQPIILFVEHQTTGGYPKPANVISADFWRLGQLRPRDQITFERVTIEQALRLLQQQEQWLYGL